MQLVDWLMQALQSHGELALFLSLGLGTAWLVATHFGFDVGTAAGMLAGALTESATVGTAAPALAAAQEAAPQRSVLWLSGGQSRQTTEKQCSTVGWCRSRLLKHGPSARSYPTRYGRQNFYYSRAASPAGRRPGWSVRRHNQAPE